MNKGFVVAGWFFLATQLFSPNNTTTTQQVSSTQVGPFQTSAACVKVGQEFNIDFISGTGQWQPSLMCYSSEGKTVSIPQS